MTYGSYGPDEARGVSMDDDGNIVLSGSTGSFGAGASDIYLIKVDGSGDLLWSRTIGGAMIEKANGLLKMDDGGWLVIGTTNDWSGAGGYDGLLVRTDANGEVLWERTYGGSDWDFFNHGVLCPDGGFLLVGQTYSEGSGGDAWLVRTDDQGDTLWTRHFGGPGIDEGAGVAFTLDGGCILAGSRTSANGDLDAYVVKLDSQQIVQWEYAIGTDSTDFAKDVVATQDGGYSFVGGTDGFSEWHEHYHFKLDAYGSLLWQKHWGQVNDQEAFRHLELPNGDYATTGWTKTSGGGGKDMFLFFCDAQGDFIGQRTYGGLADDEGYALAAIPGGFLVAGTTFSYGAGSNDVFLVRTDTAGYTASELVTEHSDPLSVEDQLPEVALLVHPNPSSGIIHLPMDRIYKAVALFDGSGRMLRSWNGPIAALDLMDVADGYYFLQVKDRAGNLASTPLVLNKH